MKLLYCKMCGDIFSIKFGERKCVCGQSKGMYKDSVNAVYLGPCVPIGFNNRSFYNALNSQPLVGPGEKFEAFVIEKDCPTFIKETDD